MKKKNDAVTEEIRKAMRSLTWTRGPGSAQAIYTVAVPRTEARARTRKPVDAHFPTRRAWTLAAVCYVNEVDGAREAALLPRNRSGKAQHLDAASMRRLSSWLSRAAAWKEGGR